MRLKEGGRVQVFAVLFLGVTLGFLSLSELLSEETPVTSCPQKVLTPAQDSKHTLADYMMKEIY